MFPKMKLQHHERLKQIIDMQGLSIKALSEITEIPYRSIQNYLREEREPNAEALIKISRKMNVNLNWLLLGEGEIFKQSMPNSFSEKEIALIKHYQMMTDEVKKAFDVSFSAISQNTN